MNRTGVRLPSIPGCPPIRPQTTIPGSRSPSLGGWITTTESKVALAGLSSSDARVALAESRSTGASAARAWASESACAATRAVESTAASPLGAGAAHAAVREADRIATRVVVRSDSGSSHDSGRADPSTTAAVRPPLGMTSRFSLLASRVYSGLYAFTNCPAISASLNATGLSSPRAYIAAWSLYHGLAGLLLAP